MEQSEIVIGSRRGRLALQGFAAVVLGGTAGGLLEWSGVLASSPLGKIGQSTGLPVVALAISGVAAVVGITLVRDSWGHMVILGEQGLTVQDGKAKYTVSYERVEVVKRVALGGVVIGFRDRENWLASLGPASGVRRRTSAVVRSAYGGDILIAEKQLAMDGARFVELLRARLPEGRSV